MARNIEIKARVADPTALRERVVNVATAESRFIVQRDTFYNVPKGRLKLREFSDGTAELIYYERTDQAGPRESTYTRTPISNSASMHELLEQLLGTKSIVSKKRELFLVGGTRIHLDDVERLGHFLELEVVLEEADTQLEGERTASDLMKQLCIRPEDLVAGAYVDLLDHGTRSLR